MKKYVAPEACALIVSAIDVITLSAFGSKATGTGADWDWSAPSSVSIDDGMNV